MQHDPAPFKPITYTKEVLQFVEEYGQFLCLIPGYHGEDLLVGRQGQVLRRAGQLDKDLAGQPVSRGCDYM